MNKSEINNRKKSPVKERTVPAYPVLCEQWDVYELTFKYHTERNPFFTEVKGTFSCADEKIVVDGFYDGDDIYKVRFMPSFTGTYTWTVCISEHSAAGSVVNKNKEVDGASEKHHTAVQNISGCATVAAAQKVPRPLIFSGNFVSVTPCMDNHGPVQVRNRFYFAYADDTPFHPIGTTCYAFALQKPEIVDQTFSELEKGYFNKLRFCLLPKHYDFSLHDPVAFPFEGTPMDAHVLTRENFSQYNGAAPGNDWNFERFNPEFFRIYDNVLMRLKDMGIEADIILFHAYDRWGFSKMSIEENERYLRYVAARYSAFRNVWWSMANEYDLLSHLHTQDWNHLAEVLTSADPYGHLNSIHNCEIFFDYTKPWITHCSCQRIDLHQTTELTNCIREQYQKPVVWDEAGYEGNFPHCWGNLTPEELVRRAWEALVRGGYCGHGETYLSDDNIVWWAHGGRLKGESAKRFGFLQDFLADVPGYGLKPAKLRDDVHFQFDDIVAVPEDAAYSGDYYFFYYSIWRPSFRQIWLDDDTLFEVDVIDTWNMTVTPAGRHKGRFEVPLTGNQYMGIRLKRVL